MKDKKGFTMIELLFVMLIMSMIASIAIPSISGWSSSTISQSNKADMIAFINHNNKIVAIEGSAPIFEFSATSDNKTHVETANNIDYEYTLSHKSFSLQSVQVKNGETNEYSSFGLIINMGNMFSEECYVFNSESSTKPLLSDNCTPDSLSWDYKDTY